MTDEIKAFIVWCGEHGVSSYSDTNCQFMLYKKQGAPLKKEEVAETYNADKNPDGHVYGVDDDTLFMSGGG